MANKRFENFSYGVGMRLDEASVDKAAQQLEGKLNKVVDNVKDNLRSISNAVNRGVKDVDTKGLVSAIVEAEKELGHFNDFNPKELKEQIASLKAEFNTLKSTLGDVADSIKGFKDLGGFISDVATRLNAIEIVTPKMGKDALKADMRELESHATAFARKMSEKIAIGQHLDEGEIRAYTDLVGKYVKKVRLGINSIKASGNATTLFADEDLAKMFVNLGPILRQIGEPVEDLRLSFASLSEEFKGFYDQGNLPKVFENTAYQIEVANKKVQDATVELSKYKSEIDKMNRRRHSTGFDVATDDKGLSFENKIKRIQEYDSIMGDIDTDDPMQNEAWYEAFRKQIGLVTAAEKELEQLLKKNDGQKYLELWQQNFGKGLNVSDNKHSQGLLDWYVDQAQEDIVALGKMYAEAFRVIKTNNAEMAQLLTADEKTKGKAGRPQGVKNTPKKTTELTGEKFVVSPTLQIDQNKWAATINTALQDISKPESGKLKPVIIDVKTNKTKTLKELKDISDAIKAALEGTRNQKRDEDGNKKSAYVSAFNKSFEEFKKRLNTSKTEILPMITEWQNELKEAFKFNLTVDGLENKKKAATEVGSFVLTYIENLNEAFEKNPVRLHSNINELIEQIKSQVKNLKIEGEVDLTAGNINTAGLDGGLAKDDTVRQIYDLLASRSGGVYTGAPIYIGTTPNGDGISADVKIVEAKAKAEEKGAKAVERKVAAEQKAAKTQNPTDQSAIQADGGFDKQQIYNAIHFSIKEKLDGFTDVNAALEWVKEGANKYGKALSDAENGSEEYFKAQAAITTLLHQWRSKIAWGQNSNPTDKRYNPFYQKGVGWQGQGNLGWSKYLTQNGLKASLPSGFELFKETAFREKQGLDEPKKQKRTSSKKSQKIEESAEEMIARDFEHTKEIAQHILKLAKWAKALGTIADGLDYTITEADFKNNDTISRNGVTYTKKDLENSGGKIFSKGSRLTSEALDDFVAEYENSEDKEFKELFAFVKKLIDVQRESQKRLDAVLKNLDDTDVATKYNAADDKSEYLAKGIKSSFGRLMGKNANKNAQTSTLETLSRYGMLESFQKLSTEKNPEEIFKTLQDNVLNNANLDKMISDLSALDGNVGKTYENFINLLKIAKEFMLTSNSIQTIGQEARNWIGGTKEQRDKYKKEFNPKTGEVTTTDEVIGVERKVIENGIRQMIQEFKAIFINEAGERAFGFNDGRNIVDEFLGGNASFTKIIDFLERALGEAVDIQLSGNRGVAKDYAGVRKHERVASIVDSNAAPDYTSGVVKKTESEIIAQQIKKSQEQKQKAEENLNRLRAELNETVSDAEVVAKLLDISNKKSEKQREIKIQTDKIENVQGEIQSIQQQIANPQKSFEVLASELLQQKEIYTQLYRDIVAHPTNTKEEQQHKSELIERSRKVKKTWYEIGQKMKDSRRTYDASVSEGMIQKESAEIEKLNSELELKRSNIEMQQRGQQIDDLEKKKDEISNTIIGLRDKLSQIAPILSDDQQAQIQQYTNNIDIIQGQLKPIVDEIKKTEDEINKIKSSGNNLTDADKQSIDAHKAKLSNLRKQRDELASGSAKLRQQIESIQAKPLGGYTSEQESNRESILSEINRLSQERQNIEAQYDKLMPEYLSHINEIKFLRDMIQVKQEFINMLTKGSKQKAQMLPTEELQRQLESKTQELEKLNAESSKLSGEYHSLNDEENSIVENIVANLKNKKAQKEARIKEIDATNDSANNIKLQNERKNLEAEIAQIDKRINDGLVQTVIRIKSELAATQESIDKANTNLAGQETRLKGADSSTPTYSKGGKTLSTEDAKGLLPQAKARLDYEIEQIDTILNAYLLKKAEALTELTAKAVGGEISVEDAKKLKAGMANTKELSDNFASGKIKEEEYVNKVTNAYIAMQKVVGEVNEASARANAKQLKDAIINKQRLEEEIALLNEVVALKVSIADTPTVIQKEAPQKNKTKPQVAVEPVIAAGEVAEEVRENVTKTPATAVIHPAVEGNGLYTSGGYTVQPILGGQGLATSDNQQTIIDLLKSGIKVNGKTTSNQGENSGDSNKESKKKPTKIPSTGKVDAQADEINKLTNINKDSNVYKRYESMMIQLNDALKQAEEKGDAFTTKDADRIRGLMTNISGLGRKIIEASNAFEQLKERGVTTTEYIEDGVKSLDAEMLNMAHNDALSKNALLTDVAYDDVKQRMTYVLTDLEGSTTRVTMAYNEMFGSIVTTADKTTDSVRKVYRAVEGEMTKMVQSRNLVDDLTGNSALKNSSEYSIYTKTYENMMKVANGVRAKGTLATQQEKNELIALIKQVETARIAFEKLAKASSDFDNKIEGKAISMTDDQSLETQMKNYVLASQPWTEAQRRMIDETWKFSNAQNSAAYSVEKNKGQLASMSVVADMGTKRIGQYTQETKKYQSGMEKFMDSLKNKWKEVARYLMTFGSMYRVFAMLRQGVTYVKEIDSALTELKKVTDETEESYDRFLNTAAKTADKVGSTIKEIISSTADWARLGYSMKQATTLAESTSVLLNVSEFQSIDEATNALTSTLQAFSYTAEQSMDVVDVLNEVGNNFAVSSDGIATALKDSASSLVAANNTYEEAVALIASANRVVQDPNSVGAALRTISLRLRSTSTKELEEAGEDTAGAITSKSKLQSKVKGLTGVDILTDTGSYRSTYDILLDISKVWKDISDIDQAALLEIIAGKTRSNTAAAILSNTKDLEEALLAAQEAEGSALRENEKYLDSIQGKLDKFNNAVQTMWNNALESDFVKNVIEIGTWLIKAIDKVGLLNSSLIAIATISMIKNKQGPIAFLQSISDLITNVVSKIKGYATSVMSMATANTAVAQSMELTTVGSLKNAMATANVDVANKNAILSSLGLANADRAQAISRDILTASTISAMVAEGQLTQAQAATIMSLLGISAASNEVNAARMNELLMTTSLTSAQRGQIITQLGLSGSLKKLSADEVMNALASAGMAKADAEAIMAKLGLTAANKGLAASFATLWASMWPVFALMVGVAAIYGIVKLFDAMTVSAKEASEQLEETKNNISNLESELKSLQNELDETREKIAELTALPYLSLTQQEDLDRLEKEVELLERQIALKERQLAIEEAQLVEDAEVAINKNWGPTNKNKKDQKKLNNYIEEYQQTNEKIKNNEELYLQASKEIFDDQSLSYDTWKKMREAQGFDKDSITEDTFKSYDWQNLDKQKELLVAFDNQTKTLEADLINTASNIEKIFNDSTYAGLEYGMSDDIDDFLDDYNNAQLKWEKALYGDNSAVSAIESLWGPNASEEMKAVKNNIDEIMAEDGTWINDDEKWQSKNSKIKEYIESLDETADGYYQLDYVINELGITTDRIADYFTILNGEFNSNTLDGVTKQYADAAEVMNVLKNMSDNTFTLDGVSYDWNEFFTQDDQGKFKARSDEFAKILKNMDNDTRAAFISIVESAANAAGDISKIDWQQSISKMDLSGLGRTFDLINDEFESLNNEMFANIADDISGLIDTVGELKSALEDVAGSIELLSVAEDQMSNSGQISVKTALDLMSATDDYSKVVTVQNGVLQLAVGAQEHLTKAKFESIKTQLEASATLAEQTYQTALAANTELDYADNASVVMTAESIKAEAIGRVSAVIVALGAAMDAIQNGEWGSVFSSFGNTYTSATETVVAQSNAMKTSIAALERDAKNKRALADVYSFSDDYSSFTNNYDFDKTPGDKNGDKEKADDAFQREMDYWENRIAANQAKYGQLQNEIDRLESRGQKAGAGYYEEQIKLEGQRFSLLKQQKAAAQAHLATLEEGSDEWWEVADVLNGIEDDIDDVTASIVDLQDAIGDIETYKFEELNTRLDNLASKLGTIRDLIAPNGEEDWFDDEGNWTENGIAALATYVQELEFYKQGYKDTVDELAKYQLEYSTNEDYYESIGIHSEQELYDKTEELISQQYDYASSINDTEQSMVDMYESSIDAAEEYINTLIDGYNDYIDSVKEALDAERDLYDFKKNVQEQAKDIAELERRIASLSGSTNKSDIAERRKLEAQLYESRESLNDTYYDHAKDAQQEALDAEASAYEETMIKMVEGMRMSFEEATAEMDTFLNNVTIAVSMNADTVLAKYKETNIYLDPALTNPWEKAKTAVGNYGSDATKLMDVWKQGGYFAEFSSTAGANLSSPWNKGTNAVNAFKSSVTLAMNNVVSDINSNVNTAAGSLSKLYQQIKDTEARAASAKANIENDLSGAQNVTGGNGSITSSIATVTATLNSSGKKFEAARTAKNESEARKAAKDAVIQLAYDYYRNRGYDDAWLDRKYSSWNSSVTYHAKGTLGTKRDEWAITDEPRFGDELVLVPGKDGNLSFMRKGTSVVPAEITTNLMEWGQFTPDAMSLGGGVNVNMINNSVMKPQYDLSFDSLVHVDNCSQETLKDLEKMVDNKINKFSKELNYSIKKFAR